MTWADFYLICFALGFFFSLLSFLAGGLRWHVNLPHFFHAPVAVPHVAAGHVATTAGHGAAGAADTWVGSALPVATAAVPSRNVRRSRSVMEDSYSLRFPAKGCTVSPVRPSALS